MKIWLILEIHVNWLLVILGDLNILIVFIVHLEVLIVLIVKNVVLWLVLRGIETKMLILNDFFLQLLT